MTAMHDPAALVRRLAERRQAQLLETHISWVLLAGDLAYKIKKPVHFPFVDYSTAERRRHFCAEELRLNRRYAPSLYLGLSRITGTPDTPAIDGPGATLETAVRMRRLPPGALFGEQLAAGTLARDAVDRLAARVAAFHAAAPAAPKAPGAAHDRLPLVAAALEGAGPLLASGEAAGLRHWIEARCRDLQPLWATRRALGRVRECHGDLHLDNVFSLDGEVGAFDCIEFDDGLRWIDVLDDAAFALMDFDARGRTDLGWRFFNGWLERTGDHDALPALPFAVVARALVRAQVEHLRRPGGEAAHRYARTAVAWWRGGRAQLAITHGLPGSGKTFASERLLESLGAVRLRSDVERKRLFRLDPQARSQDLGVDLYTPEATRRTYARLLEVARAALQAGLPVVLDAAFLRAAERREALALARELQVPFSIVACKAPLPVLRQRLHARTGDASEADVAVLEKLRTTAEPLQAHELRYLVPPPLPVGHERRRA